MQLTKRITPFILLPLLTWLFFMPPAKATVLFAGGEDLDFTFIGSVSIDTSGFRYRSSYARAALQPRANDTSDPPNNRIITPAFSNQSTIWVHAEVYQTSGGQATSSGSQMMTAYGSDGVRRIMIRGTGTGGQMKISKRTSAGSFTDLVTCAAGSFPIDSTLTKLDWYINYAVSGHTTLYVNGANVCDYAGDVTTDSITAVKQVDFGYTNALDARHDYWSEIIVADSDTRDMNLFTCAPQAAGTTQNWTGSASSVNPTTINDANSIYTGASNTIGTWTCPSLVSGTFTVPSVVQSVRTQIGSTGPQNFRYIARPAGSGSDYDNGGDIAGTASFGNTQNIWATSPATSSAWTPAELGSGVNFGLKSRP